MAKNSFYLAAKRSEYRNNFLPFDYYDFWITAKENENLRCQNKIRDYVHTPFDWDEDQDYYLESNDKYNQATQATQTTERPRTIAAIAPWVEALFQYKPKVKGTKAPTSGTW